RHIYLFTPITPPPPRSTLFPYTTLFRSGSSLKKLATNAEGAGTKIGTLGKSIAGGLVSGIKTAGTAILGATAAFLATGEATQETDRKSTRLNSSHVSISYAVFCLKKKKT